MKIILLVLVSDDEPMVVGVGVVVLELVSEVEVLESVVCEVAYYNIIKNINKRYLNKNANDLLNK